MMRDDTSDDASSDVMQAAPPTHRPPPIPSTTSITASPTRHGNLPVAAALTAIAPPILQWETEKKTNERMYTNSKIWYCGEVGDVFN